MEPLTTEEATRLIKLTKQSLIDILSSPDTGANVEFDASHEDTGDLFTVKIYRGKINKNKYEKNGIFVLPIRKIAAQNKNQKDSYPSGFLA